MMTKTTWVPWHHLSIGIVTLGGIPVQAVVYGEDGFICSSTPSDAGWSAVAGTSPNLPRALAKIAEIVS
jgi:hypothetical protein